MDTHDPFAPERRWWCSQRIRPFMFWSVAVLAVFAIYRAGLLWACRDRLGDASFAAIAQCFHVGLLFDAFVLGAAGLPLALALTLPPNRTFSRMWFRRLVTLYVTALLVFVVVLSAVGVGFFFQFGFRMNGLALDTLLCPREIAGTIWSAYPVGWVTLGLALLFYVLYRALMRWFWAGPEPSAPAWLRPVLAAVLVGLCAVCIRGGLTDGPARMCQATLVGGSNLLSQAALNDVCSLEEAIRTELREEVMLPAGCNLPPARRAAEVVRTLYYQPGDQGLGAPGNPLWRQMQTGAPPADYNVVFIIMEKLAGRGVGALGHTPSETPRLDALCREGLFFDRMYATGMVTCHGLVGVLCSHPDTCNRSVMIEPQAQGRFFMLPQLFRQRGYRTSFFCGGRRTWENVQAFFVDGGGFDEFVSQEEMLPRPPDNPWGVDDVEAFQKVHERLLGFGDQKFFAAVMTITNHEPFTAPPVEGLEYVPEVTYEDHKTNCYRYADYAIGRFFDLARTAPYFKKTIFVLVADHGRDFAPNQFIDLAAYRIPCVIYAPGLVPPRRISTVCSQTDIGPTILSMLGGSFDHCLMGRNLLAVNPRDGFAFIHVNGIMGLVRGDRAVIQPPGRSVMLYQVTPTGQQPISDDAARLQIPPLQEEMLSIYGESNRLFRESLYGPPRM
jgi:hypothetical protein